MRLFNTFIAGIVAVGLVLTPVSAVGIAQSPLVASGSAGNGGLLAADCNADIPQGGPLPPRPVLTRTTFAAHAPRPPVRHRTVVKKKTIARKVAAPVKKAVHKPVAKKQAHKKPIHKKHAAKGPRKLAPRRTIARKPVAPNTGAGAGRPTLRRVTFAAPVCFDRAPVMQAFGLDDVSVPTLSDELAQAIESALAPENTDFAVPVTTAAFNNGPVGGRGGFDIPPFFQGGSGGGGFVPPPQGPASATPPTDAPPGDSPPTDTPPGTTPGGGDTPGGGGDTPIVPGAAPEPSSWALMILGFGGIGASLRRRRPIAQPR
jgi:hypothetical protein